MAKQEKERLQLYLPEGTKAAIREACAQHTLNTGKKMPVNTFIVQAIMEKLEQVKGDKNVKSI